MELINTVFVEFEKDFKISEQNTKKIVRLISDELNCSINSIQINFVGSEYLKEVNKQFLDHNYYTDIITFNYSEKKSTLEGEIFISVEDAAENSDKFGSRLNNELIRLIAHGILHLIGYNDLTESEKEQMTLMENKFISLVNESDNCGILINE